MIGAYGNPQIALTPIKADDRDAVESAAPKRQFGLLQGKIHIPDDFDEPDSETLAAVEKISYNIQGSPMSILLIDTHIFLWLLSNDKNLMLLSAALAEKVPLMTADRKMLQLQLGELQLIDARK
ncbi:MAG TPA: hypothetical protein VK978_01385 [Candidatus Saccharimonadales bacterium]|nr:hypothetical protein [Candidatus Saccharimonadales bacterium]